MRIPARANRGHEGRPLVGYLVYINDDGECVIENASGRASLSDPDADGLELQMPDGRWLSIRDAEVVEEYFSSDP
jgi:hypothetical protein